MVKALAMYAAKSLSMRRALSSIAINRDKLSLNGTFMMTSSKVKSI